MRDSGILFGANNETEATQMMTGMPLDRQLRVMSFKSSFNLAAWSPTVEEATGLSPSNEESSSSDLLGL